ncbi:hypothetical protein PENSUB_13278 [Penicillium subrubescens]|uniref:Uncharacterized protein n=1 Tax=Penicillium subrubescens TaxID=1316194 RepID=A0A1Q5SRD6_9EURO|nr:hypothetical protein PENSUB_13278 [Penicillium subrubescens]
MNVLIVELYYTTPATAMAANNLVRCFLGAGTTAAVNPLINIIGTQWTYCAVSGALVAVTSLLLLVYFRGWDWRRAQAGLPVTYPDVVLPGTGIQTIILHWYQSNFTFSCNGAGDSGVLKPGDDHGGDKHDSNTAPYIPPQPPVGSHHRYVFLLFNQSQSYEFPDCFEHIPPQTKDARSGFDIREFMLVADVSRRLGRPAKKKDQKVASETRSQSPVLEITDPSECEKKPRKPAKKKGRHGANPNSTSRARSGRNAEKAPDEDRLQSTQAAEGSDDQSEPTDHCFSFHSPSGSHDSEAYSPDNPDLFAGSEGSSDLSCSCYKHVMGQLVKSGLRPGANGCSNIDGLLACQKELVIQTEAIMQCKVCSQSENQANMLMIVIVAIDSVLTMLDTAVTPSRAGCYDETIQSREAGPGRKQRDVGAGFKSHMDACPLLVGGFPVPAEEKAYFIRQVLQARLAMLLLAVRRIRVCMQQDLTAALSRGRLLMIMETDRRLQLVMMKIKIAVN